MDDNVATAEGQKNHAPVLDGRELLLRFRKSEDLTEAIDCWNKLKALLDCNANEPSTTLLCLKEAQFVDHQMRTFCDSMLGRMATEEYNGQCCQGQKVLVIGGGPCGLRLAIEALLLGAEVHVIEKRGYVSRNNILHLWQFAKEDLVKLGIKSVYPQFCTGDVQHVSIRTLQMALLKLSLMLGVHFHVPVAYLELRHPDPQAHGLIGWRVKTEPSDHPVSLIDFDILVDASGKHGILAGFERRPIRSKKAIAITANFTNFQTDAEKEADQIPGIQAQYYSAKFKEIKDDTYIELENLVYYKDKASHYFVMTVKRESLTEKKLVKKNYGNMTQLLEPANIDFDRLKYGAKQVAFYATKYAFKTLEFQKTHKNEDDVAIFEFASRKEASQSCLAVQAQGRSLLMCLVGDSLLEPFWPEGTGIAKGFLGVLDAAWLIRQWVTGDQLAAVTEKEHLLAQLRSVTPDKLKKELKTCTIDPRSRYAQIPEIKRTKEEFQKLILDEKDFLLRSPQDINEPPTSFIDTGKEQSSDLDLEKSLSMSFIKRESTLEFFQQCLKDYSDIVEVQDLDKSWENGKALCCLIHKIMPEKINLNDVKTATPAELKSKAQHILEDNFGVKLPRHLKDKNMEEADEIVMHVFLTRAEKKLKEQFSEQLRKPARMLEENSTNRSSEKDHVVDGVTPEAERRNPSPLPVIGHHQEDIPWTKTDTLDETVNSEPKLGASQGTESKVYRGISEGNTKPSETIESLSRPEEVELHFMIDGCRMPLTVGQALEKDLLPTETLLHAIDDANKAELKLPKDHAGTSKKVEEVKVSKRFDTTVKSRWLGFVDLEFLSSRKSQICVYLIMVLIQIWFTLVFL